MNWQEKLHALNAIADVSLRMRKPGDWYVDQSVEIGGMNCLLLGDYGNGVSPEEAVQAHWQRLVVDLKPKEYLVIHAGTEYRKHFRWNDFMWKELQVEKQDEKETGKAS